MKHPIRKMKRSPHTKSIRRFSAVLALILIWGSMWYLPTFAVGYTGEGNTIKISVDLLERMEASDDPDEMFSVDVWLNTISSDAIDAEMRATYGVSLNAFEDEEVYETQTLPAIEAEAMQAFGVKDINQSIHEAVCSFESIYSLERGLVIDTITMAKNIKQFVPVLDYVSEKTLETGIETGKTILEIYEIAKSKQFKSYRNASVKKLITAQADNFLSKNDLECVVTYKGRFVSVITMLTTKENIFRIAKMQDVKEISLNEISDDTTAFTRMNSIRNRTTEEWPSDDALTEMIERHSNNTSYTGYGVTIGVLEGLGTPVSNEYLEGVNRFLPHLQGADIMWYEYAYSLGMEYPIGGTSPHAELVVSAIVAQDNSVSLFGKGIAPEAAIIGMTFNNEVQFRERIETLIEENEIDIINISASANYNRYDSFCQFVDNFIVQNNIPIVLAVGNNASIDISAPALSYNAIVVGSADIKEIPRENAPSDFEVVAGNSRFNQHDERWITNKPDLCAFKYVSYPTDSSFGLLKAMEGSSFAAPRVAATIALMMSANSILKHQDEYVKAILLATADNIIEDYDGNVTVEEESLLRIKSGAGLLNLGRACSVASSSMFRNTSISLKDRQEIKPEQELEQGEVQNPVELATFSRSQLNVNAGKTIRVALCFNKVENVEINEMYWNDFALSLSYGGQEVACSQSKQNNVEIIEYTAAQSGQYKIHVDLVNYRLLDYWSTEEDTMFIAVSYCLVD